MALAFDAASSTAVTTSPSDPIVLSHTCSSGSERLLVVMVQWTDADGDPLSVSGVTYNGVAMTHLGAADSTLVTGLGLTFKHEIWSLVAPATGANDVSVDIVVGTPFAIVVGAASFTGADQVTPLGTPVTASDLPISGGGGGTAPSVTISSAGGEIAIAGVSTGFINFTALTSNDTEMWNRVDSAAVFGGGYGAGGQRIAGAGSVTIDWTTTPSEQEWVAAGVSVKASAGAGDSGALSADGTGAATLTGASIASAVLGMDGAATAIFTSTNFVESAFSSTGAGTVQLVGASDASGAISSAGVGVASLVGADASAGAPAAPADVPSAQEGFFGAAQGRSSARRKKRQREEELELVEVLKALGPYLMRPRKTLH